MSTNSKSFDWEPVIGLEIHVQLSTKSKIFSNAPTKFGIEQNLQASIIDLGLPGVLPVLNKNAILNLISLKTINAFDLNSFTINS